VKPLAIAVLLLAAALAAAATRPSEQSFRDHVARRMAYDADGLFARLSLQRRTDAALAGATYRRRLLWCEIEQGGQVTHRGVFSHWLKRAEPRPH
jgi:hypothetical protein